MSKRTKVKTTNHYQTPQIRIQKTIKLFIDGAFPRTESGRHFPQLDKNKNTFAQLCRASRKDLRNAVLAAKKAQGGWESKSAYNRSQILYRIAEMLESRRSEFISLFVDVFGLSTSQANDQFKQGLESVVYFAGFCDKIQQIAGCINPVATGHHNFTCVEATGVVGVISEQNFSFSKILENLCATIGTGNTTVLLLGEKHGALLAPLAEVLATSDVPKGVVNVLTGFRDELISHFSSHMEINALLLPSDIQQEQRAQVEKEASFHMKRTHKTSKKSQLNTDPIIRTVEFKTVWHPMGY